MGEKPVVEERENGPLVVKGLHRMVGPDGAEVEVKPVMALCRCGASQSKPFCDGSHNEIGFESRGGKPAGIDKLISYDGQDVSVTYNPLLCSHAAECGRLASHIFNPAQKPWVQPDKGTVAEVEAVVTACPSGALALKRADGGANTCWPSAATWRSRRTDPIGCRTRHSKPRVMARAVIAQIRAVPLWQIGQQAVLRRNPPRCGLD